MSEREKCGDYEIFEDDEGWWVVKNIVSEVILGKFIKKEDALEKIAFFLKDNDTPNESESVC